MMGGALGLAVLASVAAARTAGLQSAGVEGVSALNAGYQLAFAFGAAFALWAAGLAAVVMRESPAPAAGRPAADSLH